MEYLLDKAPKNYKLITQITDPIEENVTYCFKFAVSKIFDKYSKLIVTGTIVENNMAIQVIHSKKLKYLFFKNKTLYLMGKIQKKACFFPQPIEQPKNTIEVTYAPKTDISKIKSVINKIPYGNNLVEVFNNIYFPTDLEKTQKSFNYLAAIEILIFRKLLMERVKSIDPMYGEPSVTSIELTEEQKSVMGEITQDLQSDKTTVRLVHGEVGSGKTMLILFSASKVVNSGKKVIIMAPTALLAEQIYEKFLHYTKHKVCLVTSNRNNFRQDREIFIGTQALLFLEQIPNVGLVIIDEQHKFGVLQRNKLCDGAHLLMLTATPIPRTLKMSVENLIHFSNMQHSLCNKTNTYVVAKENSDNMLSKIADLSKKTKVIWICRLVSEAQVTYDKFSPITKSYLIHGSVKNKSDILEEFKSAAHGILVATTVIEVGIDTDVNVIVIDHADKYGLAQIHQLRGRVGRRKDNEGHCILIGEDLEKLQTIKNASSGMEISQLDLENRKGGLLYDKNQSGKESLKFIRDITSKPSLQQIINYSYEIENIPKSLEQAMLKVTTIVS